MSAPAPRMYYKTLASPRRLLLLDALQTRGPLTLSEITAATGLHPNTARGHLQQLIEAGLVHADPIPRAARGRPELRYRTATAPGDRERQTRRRAAESRLAGSRQRAAQGSARLAAHQLSVLDDHMKQSGFGATIDPRARCMTMHDCPFRALAEQNPRVCHVHHALIADALRLVDGPVRAGVLHRRAPGVSECTLELTVAAATASTPHSPNHNM